MTAEPWTPRLCRQVRLHHDRVRGADLLLMPEKVVRLSPEAARIVALCGQGRTVAEIIAELSARYPAAPLDRDVPAFLDRLRAQGWLR